MPWTFAPFASPSDGILPVRRATLPCGRVALAGYASKLQFVGEIFLCTFLSSVTEKYQKNTAKGLSALWTPACPLWVFLTGEIHGGVSQSAPPKRAETLFSLPAKLNPKQMRGHSRLLRFQLPRRKTINSLLVGRLLQNFFCPTRETAACRPQQSGELRAVGAPPSARVFGSWRPDAQSDSFAPPWAKESRRLGGGFLKGGPVGDSLEWRSFVKCEALRLSSRHGEKGTKTKRSINPNLKSDRTDTGWFIGRIRRGHIPPNTH